MNATSKTGKLGQRKREKARSGGVENCMKLLSRGELSPEEQETLRQNGQSLKKIISKMRAQALYRLGSEESGRQRKRLWHYQSILNDLLMELNNHD